MYSHPACPPGDRKKGERGDLRTPGNWTSHKRSSDRVLQQKQYSYRGAVHFATSYLYLRQSKIINALFPTVPPARSFDYTWRQTAFHLFDSDSASNSKHLLISSPPHSHVQRMAIPISPVLPPLPAAVPAHQPHTAHPPSPPLSPHPPPTPHPPLPSTAPYSRPLRP